MFVTELKLVDFRNYQEATLELTDGVTVFVGSNGQGKTNLVEAVEYLSTMSSHRVAATAPLIRAGADSAIVRAKVQAAVQRVVEEGIASSAFAVADARRGVGFVFDALHRFIHPVSVGLDREAPNAAVQQRLDRVTRVVARTLTSGRM